MKSENKWFIIVLLFILLEGILLSEARASVSFTHVRQVFARMQNMTGYHVPLCYDKDARSNAYSMSHQICITQGMLKELQNSDQVAMVLGHELAHYAGQHPRHPNSMTYEIEADRIGYKYCRQMGYKHCLSFLLRMKELHGDGGKDGIHPTWTERLRRLRNA